MNSLDEVNQSCVSDGETSGTSASSLVPTVPPTPTGVPTPTGKARANPTKARVKRAKARHPQPVSVGQVGVGPPVDAWQKVMFTEAQRTGALALKRAKAIMSTDGDSRIQNGKSE